MKQIGVAIVGLGWWGRNIAGLLKGNPKLSRGGNIEPVTND